MSKVHVIAGVDAVQGVTQNAELLRQHAGAVPARSTTLAHVQPA